MHPIDTSADWTAAPQATGLFTRLLSGDFDEANARGFRTRLVRFEPGGGTFEPYVHAYWEEIYLVEGDLASLADRSSARAPAYVIRPPGTPHGPFVSQQGCLLLEVQYFADRKTGVATHLDRRAPQPVSG
ncbi:MAG: cupin domain-containing protein [Methylobacteriaceae bacterium]|nr:cupin domain-containing protein [Methylobacteriaceae bacterium]